MGHTGFLKLVLSFLNHLRISRFRAVAEFVAWSATVPTSRGLALGSEAGWVMNAFCRHTSPLVRLKQLEIFLLTHLEQGLNGRPLLRTGQFINLGTALNMSKVVVKLLYSRRLEG